MIALVMIGFAIIALWQIPNLLRNGWRKELVTFMVLWSAGLILSVLLSIGVRIPPVTTEIDNLLSGLF